MIKYMRFKDSGEYTAALTGEVDSIQYEDETRIYVGEHIGFDHYHDIAANLPVPMPTKPSDHHIFNYTVKQWELNSEAAWYEVTTTRNQKLSSTDWVVTKAIETGVAVLPEWVLYRQALRDITKQADPLHIVWPVLVNI